MGSILVVSFCSVTIYSSWDYGLCYFCAQKAPGFVWRLGLVLPGYFLQAARSWLPCFSFPTERYWHLILMQFQQLRYLEHLSAFHYLQLFLRAGIAGSFALPLCFFSSVLPQPIYSGNARWLD